MYKGIASAIGLLFCLSYFAAPHAAGKARACFDGVAMVTPCPADGGPRMSDLYPIQAVHLLDHGSHPYDDLSITIKNVSQTSVWNLLARLTCMSAEGKKVVVDTPVGRCVAIRGDRVKNGVECPELAAGSEGEMTGIIPPVARGTTCSAVIVGYGNGLTE